MRSRLGFILALGVCGIILSGPAALAGPVTVQITGHVIASDFGTIGVGSPVIGVYHYDDTLPDMAANENNGWYTPVTFGLSFVDGSTMSTTEAHILINNDSSGIGTTDEYVVAFPSDAPWGPYQNTLTGAFEGLAVYSARFYRNDTTGVAWDNVDLPDPETILSLLPGEDNHVYLDSTPWGVEQYFLRFTVTDLAVMPQTPAVPVPGALALAGLGLAGIRRLRRRIR